MGSKLVGIGLGLAQGLGEGVAARSEGNPSNRPHRAQPRQALGWINVRTPRPEGVLQGDHRPNSHQGMPAGCPNFMRWVRCPNETSVAVIAR
ncbi:hypothetical protein, partial [Methylobacterium sp. WL2]|uniref:hypothetical protein n=1 Tax=Methylobacterium sp. WL2 TaxID=2603902 RepID=UPI001AEE018E